MLFLNTFCFTEGIPICIEMSNIDSEAATLTTFNFLSQHLIEILIRPTANTDQILAVVFPSRSIYYYIENLNSTVLFGKKNLLTKVKLKPKLYIPFRTLLFIFAIYYHILPFFNNNIQMSPKVCIC
jgi:hypothetical protein